MDLLPDEQGEYRIGRSNEPATLDSSRMDHQKVQLAALTLQSHRMSNRGKQRADRPKQKEAEERASTKAKWRWEEGQMRLNSVGATSSSQYSSELRASSLKSKLMQRLRQECASQASTCGVAAGKGYSTITIEAK